MEFPEIMKNIDHKKVKWIFSLNIPLESGEFISVKGRYVVILFSKIFKSELKSMVQT